MGLSRLRFVLRRRIWALLAFWHTTVHSFLVQLLEHPVGHHATWAAKQMMLLYVIPRWNFDFLPTPDTDIFHDHLLL
jgi:hypothetical protein